MNNREELENINIKLDGSLQGYFETEWYSSYKYQKERKDIDESVKSSLMGMYANLLLQLWSSRLKSYKKIKEEKSYDEFYTEELVDKIIGILEKEIEEIKPNVKYCSLSNNYDQIVEDCFKEVKEL